MPHSFDRTRRVADLIKHEIAKLLIRETRDPRFAFVTVTDVEVAKDYSTARIFVTVLDETKIDETISALNKASGFFRSQLAHVVNMRSTPRIIFLYDESVARGQRISDLLSNPTSSSDPSQKKE